MFDNKYRAILADTEESRDIHYSLRYQVYCLEKGFEPAHNFKDELEKDKYDDNSVHFLIQEKSNGNWVGTVRLVIVEPQNLPILEYTEIEEEKLDSKNRKVAELSRLSILRDYRRTGDKVGKSGLGNEPEILLGLIRATNAYCKEAGISNWVFLCRRAIRRIVSKVGIRIDIIGPPCEHRGTRYPFLGRLNSGFDGISEVSPETQEMMSQKSAYSRYSDLYGYDYEQAAA